VRRAARCSQPAAKRQTFVPRTVKCSPTRALSAARRNSACHASNRRRPGFRRPAIEVGTQHPPRIEIPRADTRRTFKQQRESKRSTQSAPARTRVRHELGQARTTPGTARGVAAPSRAVPGRRSSRGSRGRATLLKAQ
jgi:hypothetical protein